MNAAFLILSSACLTGADPVPFLAPAPPLAAAPADKAPAEKPPGDKAPPEKLPAPPAAVVAPIASGSYGGCSTCCENAWTEKKGFFSRWKGGCGKSCDTCAAPTVHAAPCATCDTCAKPSFFSKFKWKSKSCDSCDSGCASGCAPAYGTVIQTAPGKPGEPVKSMPKEGGEPKKLPEGKEISIQIAPEVTPTTSKTIELGTQKPF